MSETKDERAAGDLLELELKGMKWRFRWCPAGSFMMGSPSSEIGHSDNDETRHKVTLTQGFWLGETQVTQEQWKAVTGKNPSNFRGAKLPVESVSWNICRKFARKLNEIAAEMSKEGLLPNGYKFSLPTEAQWEYACRAGAQTAFCFGDDWKELEKYAWYSGHKDFDEWKDSKEFKNRTVSKWGKTTHEVGTKEKNAWGLYDMHGNVWEWCQDWYGYYPKGDVVDPVASFGDGRVDRGGSWFNHARDCRSADRDSEDQDDRYDNLGLRLAIVESDK